MVDLVGQPDRPGPRVPEAATGTSVRHPAAPAAVRRARHRPGRLRRVRLRPRRHRRGAHPPHRARHGHHPRRLRRRPGHHALWVRPHLITPVRVTSALNAANIDRAVYRVDRRQSDDRGRGRKHARRLGPVRPDHQRGRPRIHRPGPQACRAARRASRPCQASIGGLHLRQLVTYQPASRYWAFQWYETAIFLAAGPGPGRVLLLVGPPPPPRLTGLSRAWGLPACRYLAGQRAHRVPGGQHDRLGVERLAAALRAARPRRAAISKTYSSNHESFIV